jgi:transcriptional regulator with XRE-family HTH domain
VSEDEIPTHSLQEANFAAQVKAQRTARGWSQQDMARQLQSRGIDYMNGMTVSRIESGQRPVRLVEAWAFQEVFGVSVFDLMNPEGVDGWIESMQHLFLSMRTSLRDLRAGLAQYESYREDAAGVADELEAEAKKWPNTHPRHAALAILAKQFRWHIELDVAAYLSEPGEVADVEHSEAP